MSDAVYLNQIQQLVDLQRVDDEIFAVKQELDKAPRALTDLEQRFEAVEERRNHILDKLDHLQDQKKRLDLEIDDDSAKIKKSKNKLMQVGNDREYQAMLREMDSMEKINRNRKEEETTLLEELQSTTERLAEIDSEFNAIREERDAKRASLDSTLASGRQELEKLEKRRDIFSQSIDRPVFQRYEFIRKRLEHPVIVDVEEGICSGCHIAIPPQTFIELQTGQQILSCPNCQRLIFWSRHFEMPVDLAPAQKKNTEPASVENVEEDEPSDQAE